MLDEIEIEMQLDLPVVTGILQNGHICSHQYTLAMVAPQRTSVFSASLVTEALGEKWHEH